MKPCMYSLATVRASFSLQLDRTIRPTVGSAVIDVDAENCLFIYFFRHAVANVMTMPTNAKGAWDDD